MLQHVRQSLLHDAVRGEIDAGRQRPGRALGHGLDGQAGAADGLEQLVELCESWLGHQLGLLIVGFQHPDQTAHLGHAEPAGVFDPAQGQRCLTGIALDHRSGGSGLDDHHAHRMRDDVVQLTGDAGAFLHDGVVGHPFPILAQTSPTVEDRAADGDGDRHREGHAAHDLEPVEPGLRGELHRGPRHERHGRHQREDPLTGFERGGRVGRQHQRHDQVVGVADRGVGQRGRGHGPQHRHGCAAPGHERHARDDDQGERHGVGIATAGLRVSEGRGEKREPQDRRGEEAVHHQRVDPAQALPPRASFHDLDGSGPPSDRRHPAERFGGSTTRLTVHASIGNT